jgi:predicted transcriptional regulator
MRPNKRNLLGLLMVLVGFMSACQGRHEGWTPVLEETSTAFLEAETQRVLERVRAAREEVAADPSGAEESLRHAESSLEHLIAYYLPVLQARERAYNAYRSFLLEDQGRVARELAQIETLLEGMAETASGPRLQEIEHLAEVLADARVAVESGPQEGRPALESLARTLNQAALKGELILQG